MSDSANGPVNLAGALPTVAEIHEAATQRQARIRSVDVEYHAQHTRLAEAPSAKSRLQTKYRVHFKTDGRRSRSHASEFDPRSPETITVFDGRHCLEFEPRSKMAILANKMRSSLTASEHYCAPALQFLYRDCDKVQYDNGWFYPHVLREFDGERLYRVLPQFETIDGASCLVVEYAGRDKLWIDCQLHGVVRRRQHWELVGPDESWLDTDYRFSDFVEAEPQLFVPRRCTYTTYGSPADPPHWKNVPVSETQIQVNRIVLNQVSDEDFRIDLPGGIRVLTEDNRRYDIPSEGSTEKLDELVAHLPPPRNWSDVAEIYSRPDKPALVGTPENDSDVLKLSQTSVDLGAVPLGSRADHRFVIQNRSSQELLLTHGLPSGYADVSFEPSNRIPALGTATLLLELDIDKRVEGGAYRARVTIGVEGSSESHEVELKAQAAGMVIFGSPSRLVAWPVVPGEVDVVLGCYSLERDHQPNITSLRAVKLMPLPVNPVAEPLPKSMVEGLWWNRFPDALELSLGQAEVAPVEQIVDGLFVRRVKFPVRLTTSPERPFEARLLVNYEMGGSPLPSLAVPLMILN